MLINDVTSDSFQNCPCPFSSLNPGQKRVPSVMVDHSHTLSVEQVLQNLGVNVTTGLTESEARILRFKYGRNGIGKCKTIVIDAL